MQYFLNLGDLYACRPNVVNGTDVYIRQVEGNHLEGKSYFDVEALTIYYQNLPTFPKNIAELFPNLKDLECQSSKMMSISAEDLRPFPNLLALLLFGNNLVSIDSDLFRFTPKIQHISFDKNLIEHVGEGLLTGLDNLSRAGFENNTCIHFMAYSQNQVPELVKKLEKCPPKCNDECYKKLEGRFYETEKRFEEKFATLVNEIKAMKINEGEQRNIINESEERIVELEKQIREMIVRP